MHSSLISPGWWRLNVEAYRSKDGRNILGVPVVHALFINISRLVETKVKTDFGKVYQEKGELKEIICLGFLKYFSQFGQGSDSGRTVFEQGLDRVRKGSDSAVFGHCSNSVRAGFKQCSEMFGQC